MRSIITFFIFVVGATAVFSQDCSVSGRVLDDHGHILPGATVQIQESSHGTTANEEGFFRIVTGCESIKITFKYLGFTTVDTAVSGNVSNLIIKLTSSSEELHELIVEEHKSEDHASLNNNELSADELRTNDQGTLAKTLEQIPGIQAINVGVGISKPVLRGMSMNRVVVTGNGVKQEGQQWGADHGLEMDPFDAEHVEVVKGPSTLKYGSGSAAGVINVLPFAVAAKDSIEGEFTTIYKSNNNHIGASGMVKFHKKNWFGRVRASGQQFGDYRVPSDSFIYNRYQLPIYDERLKNTAGHEYSGSGEVGVMKDWGISRLTLSTYQLQAGIFPGAMGIPRSYDLVPDGDLRNIDLPYQQVAHNKLVSSTKLYTKDGKGQYQILGSWQQNIREEYAVPHAHGSAQTGSLALSLHLNTYNLDVLAKRRINGLFQHEWGIQNMLQVNQIGGFEFLIPKYNSFETGGFYILTYTHSDKVEINGGGRFGFFQIDAAEAELFGTADSTSDGSVIRSPAFNRTFFNWSASIGMRYELNKNNEIKVNANRSYRNPSIAELGSNGVHHGTFRHEKGNPNLEQENGIHFDLSYQYGKESLKFNVAAFSSYYNNFIYLRPTAEFSNLPEGGQLFVYSQNDAFYTGGELSLNYDFFSNWEVKLGGDYVWNYNLDTRLPLPFTPPGRFITELNYSIYSKKLIRELKLIAGYNYVLAQNRVDRNEPSTPEYHLLRAGFTSRIHLGEKLDVKLNCMVQNLLDTYYLNHLSRYRYINIPEQGRNVVIGLEIPFGI